LLTTARRRPPIERPIGLSFASSRAHATILRITRERARRGRELGTVFALQGAGTSCVG
jgi:hypothetical protein